MLHRDTEPQIYKKHMDSHRTTYLTGTETRTGTTTGTINSFQAHAWKGELFVGRNLRVDARELRNWPLKNYLWAAIFHAKDLFDRRDSDLQNWQTPAWDFGRFAKAHPDLIDLDENTALLVVKAAIGWRFWETHLDMDCADAEIAFDDIWVKCRAVPGYDPVTLAVRGAKESITETAESGPAGYQTFLEVAKRLHHQLGGEAFMLPCHKLAAMLGCKPMTISRYRQKAIREGFLRIEKEHSFRSRQKGEATEFSFCDEVAFMR